MSLTRNAILTAGLVGILSVDHATAFVRQRTPPQSGGASPLRWAFSRGDDGFPAPTALNAATGAMIVTLDAGGFETGNTRAELDAMITAMEQWSSIPNASLKFEFSEEPGLSDVTPGDGVSAVMIAKESTVFNGGLDTVANLLAVTKLTFDANGRIVEADIVFNGAQYDWTAVPEDVSPNLVSIEEVARHETGHWLGLDHSPVGGSVMTAEIRDGDPVWLGLTQDELSFARAVYPDPTSPPEIGAVAGRIQTATGLPVAAAAVYAIHRNGLVMGGTISESDGAYRLEGLPPGDYTIRAAALDANALSRGESLNRPVDIAPRFSSLPLGFVEFQNSESEILVNMGETATVDFRVTPETPAFRLTGLQGPVGHSGGPFGPKRLGRLVLQGSSGLYFGVFGRDLPNSDVNLSVSGGGVTFGSPTVFDNALGFVDYISAPISVDASAAPGLRAVELSHASGIDRAHGYLDIAPSFPDNNYDGLDDRFQRAHFQPYTRSEAAPLADPDDDGFPNAREASAETDPTDPRSLSFNIVEVDLSADGARVTWESAPGKAYRLESKASVEQSEWAVVADSVLAVDETTQYMDEDSTEFLRFYRAIQID